MVTSCQSLFLSLFLLLTALVSESTAYALGKRAPRPALAEDFPDPAIIQTGGTWYAFATQGNGVHVQIATSSDFDNWSRLGGKDALPNLPNWVDAKDPNVWAPNVIQNDQGQFVMYFSAALSGNTRFHCLGTAVSSSVTGPYTPNNQQFACPTGDGGAIDASGYKDTDGSRWVVYKVDGNNVGSGGLCNNGNAPQHTTPILLQRVSGNGYTPQGNPTQVLDRDNNDGPLIEAPSLSRINNRYVLWFSSNCYSTTMYDVSFAVASNLAGGYTKRGPMLVTGTLGLSAPGGAEVTADGKYMAFHAGPVGARYMYTARVTANGNDITICTNGGCQTAN